MCLGSRNLGLIKKMLSVFQGNIISHIFPTFALIARCSKKIVQDKVNKALLEVTHWISHSWFPMLLTMIVSFPSKIPRHKNVLVLLHNGLFHLLEERLSLVALVVSGFPSEREDFQIQLSRQSACHGDQELKNSTVWHGRRGIFGVLNGNVIPFVRLR